MTVLSQPRVAADIRGRLRVLAARRTQTEGSLLTATVAGAFALSSVVARSAGPAFAVALIVAVVAATAEALIWFSARRTRTRAAGTIAALVVGTALVFGITRLPVSHSDVGRQVFGRTHVVCHRTLTQTVCLGDD